MTKDYASACFTTVCNGPFHRFDRESQSKYLSHSKQFIYTIHARSILIRIPTIYISPKRKTHVDALKSCF